MTLDALHALLITTAKRHYGPLATVGLLASAPRTWCAWAITGNGDDSDAQCNAETPDGALSGLLARINALSTAAHFGDEVSP